MCMSVCVFIHLYKYVHKPYHPYATTCYNSWISCVSPCGSMPSSACRLGCAAVW